MRQGCAVRSLSGRDCGPRERLGLSGRRGRRFRSPLDAPLLSPFGDRSGHEPAQHASVKMSPYGDLTCHRCVILVSHQSVTNGCALTHNRLYNPVTGDEAAVTAPSHELASDPWAILTGLAVGAIGGLRAGAADLASLVKCLKVASLSVLEGQIEPSPHRHEWGGERSEAVRRQAVERPEAVLTPNHHFPGLPPCPQCLPFIQRAAAPASNFPS